MPRHRPYRCRRCGGYDHVVGRVSWSGLCGTCAEAAVTENAAGIASKQGPAFDKWQQGMQESRMRQAAKVVAEFNAVTDLADRIDPPS